MVRAQSLTATIVYTYTADGLRVGQETNGTLTTYAWDWAAGVPELLAHSPSSHSPFAHSPFLYLVGHDTLGWWDGVAWRYVLADALGSVRQGVDGGGAVVSAREWEPYGVEVGGWRAGLGYTGEWQDADVGLLYLRARWYAPGVGIFTAPDPFPGVQKEPGSLHPYLYVLANPVTWADPTGLRPPIPPSPQCGIDPNAYNLTDWLVREMHYQSTHWPVRWGISLLNEIGRHYDPYSGGAVDSVIFSLLQNLRTYIPWNWERHSYRNDIATLAYVGSSLWWAGMVKDGARWDFKDQINREFYRQFNRKGGIILCDLSECRWYEYSMPGNIFYAYVGRVAGFSEWDIRVGAIYAQQVDPENDPALNDWLGLNRWGLGLDQASDQAALELGFMMYNLTHGASDEITVRYAFKTALLVHKDRLAVGQVPTDPYVPKYPVGPDGQEFPLGYFDGTNVMGWMGKW